MGQDVVKRNDNILKTHRNRLALLNQQIQDTLASASVDITPQLEAIQAKIDQAREQKSQQLMEKSALEQQLQEIEAGSR